MFVVPVGTIPELSADMGGGEGGGCVCCARRDHSRVVCKPGGGRGGCVCCARRVRLDQEKHRQRFLFLHTRTLIQARTHARTRGRADVCFCTFCCQGVVRPPSCWWVGAAIQWCTIGITPCDCYDSLEPHRVSGTAGAARDVVWVWCGQSG
jgi:hypothetical protein